MQLRTVLFLGAGLLGFAREACADEPVPVPAPTPTPVPAPAADPPPHKSKIYWHKEWPKFSVAEAIISAAVTLRNLDLGGALDGPSGPTIKFEVPVLDHGVRSVLRADTPQGRAGAKRLSDVGFRALVLTPYVVDVALGTLALHRNGDVAWQLALIDFEVLTLAGMTQLLTSRVIGRARPSVDPDNCPDCKGDVFRSFNSGHSMASFTAAGLVCVHHEMLPLFGGGAPDTWACIWAVSFASMTATMRLVADEHWASDVLVGVGLGWAYGYYLPKLLHFHAKKATAGRANGGGGGISWMPTVSGTPESGMLGVLGTF